MLRSFEAGLSLGDRITTCAIHVDEGAYTGQWRMRGTGLVWHGQGVLRYVDWPFDRATYTGRFEDGSMTHGTMLYDRPGGSKSYSGDFVDGQAGGYGTMEEDGLRYEGQFQGGQPHGLGTLTLPNGDYCEGQFADGMASGVARQVVRSAGSFTYSGGFRSGSRHGHCIARYADGSMCV